ncbi:MAG: oligopeptide/dipeptide ABC transporter ATP-binding protein [Cereibacter sp.]
MNSTFAPDPRRRKDLVALEGEIPAPFNLPPGCAFAGRCPRASERCASEKPVLAPALGNMRSPVSILGPPGQLQAGSLREITGAAPNRLSADPSQSGFAHARPQGAQAGAGG